MKFSALILVCLLAGVSKCQPEVGGNEILETDPGPEGDAESPEEDQTALAVDPTGDSEERSSARTELEVLKEKVSALENIMTQQRAVDRSLHQIAFSVALPVSGTIGPNTHIYNLVYSRILSNYGGGYSPITGYFTAPVRGFYHFSYTSYCWAGNPRCGGSLYHNNIRYVSWYVYNPTQDNSGSNTAILLLQVGDVVNVRLWDNSRISDNGSLYSTFSGFLLYSV